MANKIRITAGSVVVDAELNDSETANAIWDALPIQDNGDIWGEEIYLRIPVDADLERAKSWMVSTNELKPIRW